MGQVVATILAIGMSWSHIRRQGQYDVDRVDEDWAHRFASPARESSRS